MSVRIGIAPGLGSAITADEGWRWIDFCEEAGVDSIWYSDQLLGATLEPLVALAALAARTRRMRFGTNALVLPFRDPLVLAKQLAAIDHLGEGRLFPVLGVGAASDPFWTATGQAPGERGKRANEAAELLRLLLERERVAFDGTHFRYDGPGVQPRPCRPIPLWIGGNSKAAQRRTAAYGDGWLGSLIGPEAAGEARRGIEAGLRGTGRTIANDHYGVTLFLRIGDAGDPALAGARARFAERLGLAERSLPPEAIAVGAAEEVIAVFRAFAAHGMSKFVAVPIANDAADLMDQTTRLVREVIPAVER